MRARTSRATLAAGEPSPDALTVPPPQLKGGVWKNSEDEILKAAVMKYGLNQWSRVASLLPRKTPKQCKARWMEWLDPSVKKTEWTREEEERLLHLAKLMPAQWRTIAPLVGRTAAQCIEHYEKLLDAAQAGEGAGAGGERKEDPRRLRPGEIDPQPEVKPARPDPVDMDEDEKEMLSEARARLANTQGKKAKRKVRERMLEEAKRLAQLQKTRELKAAGINVDGRKRKKSKTDSIDYANEVPFEKRAPAGFFDTGSEDARHLSARAAETTAFRTTLVNKIEEERGKAREAKAQADDKRKFKQMAATDLPALLASEAARDPLALRRRAPLLMPAPSVSDSELEEIARLGAAAGGLGGMLVDDDEIGGTVVTAGLLGQYGGRSEDIAGSIGALAASRRLGGGAGAASRDALLEEARNAAEARASFSAPLLGGENLAREAGTGYVGAAPSVRGRAGAGAGLGSVVGGETPSHAGRGAASVLTGVGSTFSGVGLRDAMGLNRVGAMLPPPPSASVRGGMRPPPAGAAEEEGEEGGGDDGASDVYPSDSASVIMGGGLTPRAAERAFQHRLATGVLAGLAALPKPQLSYELVVPEEEGGAGAEEDAFGGSMSYGASAAALRGSDMGTAQETEDEEEVEARREGEEAAARAVEYARRSAALRHVPTLPRPLVLDDDAIAPPVRVGAGLDAAGKEAAIASAMIQEEELLLLKRDAVLHPVSCACLFECGGVGWDACTGPAAEEKRLNTAFDRVRAEPTRA
jgi:pre-mRNA-splicing factor CDC5/CEF1